MANIVTFTEAISSNLSINSLYYLKSVTGLNLLSEILMTPGLDFKYWVGSLCNVQQISTTVCCKIWKVKKQVFDAFLT